MRQGALLAAAADADRRVRLLRALRLVARVLELVVLAVEVVDLLGQQTDQHLAGLLEAVEALPDGAEFDAVRAGLLFVPARADAELEPAVGDDVERRSHVGQHGGMAVVDAGDQRRRRRSRLVACASAVSVVQPSRHGPVESEKIG